MRDRYGEVKEAGAEVAVVGMGLPAMALDFKEKFEVPFPVLVDRTKESYRALGMKRGSLIDVAGPKMWLRATKSILSGRGQGKPQQDPFQLGGTIVIAPGDEVLLVHRSATAEENLPVDDVVRVLQSSSP